MRSFRNQSALAPVPELVTGLGDPDAALVARGQAGDRTALCELYRRHVDGVFRRLTHLIGADPDREDLTQQIFAEVLGKLGAFRGESRFQTYLYRVVSHRACDHLRRRRGRTVSWSEEAENVSSRTTSPEESLMQAQELASVWRLLERVKPKKRIAFLLRVVVGLSLEEIAEQTGARPAAVAKQVSHAQQELLAMIQRERSRS